MLRIADADAARLIALYRAGRPSDSAGDLAAVIAGDTSILRQASYTIAERKFSQRRAPVYLYSFNWRSPVRGGKLRCMHCMELPFVFDHPDLISFMTGTGRDRYELAKNMSEAWVAFARHGQPQPFRPSTVGPMEPRAVADDGLQHGDARRQRSVGRGAARASW